MAAAQANGEAGTDSVVCIRCIRISKDFAGAASVAKATFHFPIGIKLESDIAIFAYFFTDSECVFSAGVIPVPKASFYYQGRQEQIEGFPLFWIGGCAALFRAPGWAALLCFPEACGRGVKHFMQRGLYHPAYRTLYPQ